MPTLKKTFKGPSCPAGLKKAWNQRKLVLFLGAGVSQPYGLPSWNDLVLSLLLDESSRAFGGFWPHYRMPLGSWLAETFGLSAVSLARLARIYAQRNDLGDEEFQQYVREWLYLFESRPVGRTTLTDVVDLIVRSERDKKGRHIPVVVSFNYDDLLERQLNQHRIKSNPVYSDDRRTEEKLPILHVHGYLPSNDKIPQADLVFTEDEYHRLSFSNFHWSQVELVNLLRNYTVLFVGLSMTDPNLRRLLDASHSPNSKTSHYLLKKKFTLTRKERDRAHKTIAENARHQADRFGYINIKKTADLLEQAVNQMLKLAHKYETDLLQEMGVKTLWFKDFDQIGSFVSKIGERTREKGDRRF